MAAAGYYDVLEIIYRATEYSAAAFHPFLKTLHDSRQKVFSYK
jgi:hypothetical protein